jgi:hypothetical protein
MDEAKQLSVLQIVRRSCVRSLNAFNLDDKYFAYSGLATFAVGYVVYAALVDPTGILSFDQQIVNFGEKILQSTEIRRARIHEDDIVTAFLTRGNTKYGYNDQEPVMKYIRSWKHYAYVHGYRFGRRRESERSSRTMGR